MKVKWPRRPTGEGSEPQITQITLMGCDGVLVVGCDAVVGGFGGFVGLSEPQMTLMMVMDGDEVWVVGVGSVMGGCG